MTGGAMALFEWSAPLFARFADRWPPETIERYRVWLAPYVHPGGALLDLGGGTGALARRLSEALECTVTVLDPSPAMISRVTSHERVVARIGSAERMPFANDSFDAVVVSDAFHHFHDQIGAASEMSRVVRPGGGVLVLEYDPSGPMRLVAWGERLLGEPGAFFAPDQACEFFARFRIEGRCERESRFKYYFLGEVHRDAA